MTGANTGATPFHDFSDYIRIPRVIDLSLSVDGARLVATVATLNDEGNTLVNALWEIDPSGRDDARRLTWSEKGESGPAFLPDGSLLFLSAREGEDDDPPALWRMPAAGGEARRVLRPPGGVTAVGVARESGDIVVTAPRLKGVSADDQDEERRKERKDAKTSAILHELSPIRFWDHDLGPDELHLLATSTSDDGTLSTLDLTPDPNRALDDQGFVVAPDGSLVVTGWAVPDEPGNTRPQLVAIDTAKGTHRVLADEPGVWFLGPQLSRDARHLVCGRAIESTYDEPPRMFLHLIDLDSGDGHDVAAVDFNTQTAYFSPDGSAVYYDADDNGHRPVFRLDLASGQVTRLTGDGHFTNVMVHPDGTKLFALRDHIDSPPRPVRIDLTGDGADVVELNCPGGVVVPGRVEDLSTTATDGTTVRSFLVLPDGASVDQPAPFLLWIHGGPISSWNSWSWRWNPWLMAARGYAVLLPDPAFSTGYGPEMVARGWGEWGGAPYDDLMAATDAALKRDDLDDTRTAAMGGSYGGYMANWVAGHTDRFRCIVTHASLWSLDQFQGTTDHPWFWAQEFGIAAERPERYEKWSPHAFLDHIRTPMLVIHGDKDYRVPVGEGLRLWWDLQRKEVPSKYLYFSDEGHWILKPGNARVWYETVWAWLACYLLEQDWKRPALL